MVLRVYQILQIAIFVLLFLSCRNRNYTIDEPNTLSENIVNNSIKKNTKKQQKLIEGKVVGISDGDTFTMIFDNGFSIKVRLNSIDCPEKKQPFSKRAKKELSELIFDKNVVVKYKDKDRYGRVLGWVFVNDLNINEEMLKRGMAWHYKKYSDDQKLSDIEANARKNRIGLWSEPNPIAPWDYRESRKK